VALMEENFWGHLNALRCCLIKVLAAFLLSFAASIFLSRELLDLITAPAGTLVFLRPAEAFLAQLKVALVNGLVISLPVVLWQIGKFLWPALYPNERKALWLYFPFTLLLFFSGLAFGYFIVVRLGYRFLLSFAAPNLQPMISLESYLSFVLSALLACGLIFLLPVVVLFLAKIGLLKARFLIKQRSIFIVGLAILVAVITPTVDAVSMLLVFIPLVFLFEFSVFLVWLNEYRERKKDARPRGNRRSEGF
jgi:sec-independent protein translocase protein TatC